MSQRVKIKVRANQPVQFPGLCTHCARPATQGMELRQRIGRVTRMIDIPLCEECKRQLERLSGEEERLLKLGRLVGTLAFLLTISITVLLTPPALDMILRLLVAFLFALIVTELIAVLFRQARRRAALPEKQAVLNAAHIVDFSWRATTFEFANETFRQRFVSLNEPFLMET